MSKQADRLLARILESKEDGMEWDEVKFRVQSECGVQENTSEQYIRRSDEAVARTDANGDKRVFAPEYAGKAMASDNKVVEMEVGEPTGDTFNELPVLEDEGHPEIPRQHETGYIRRRMGEDRGNLSRKTDVKVITSTMADPDYSTLLIGKHGVGKDRAVLHICAKTNRPVIRLVANDDPDFVDLLIGTYAPDENGNFSRQKGLLQIALENGYTFILDEFNSLSGKVQTMLNKILEDSNQSELVIPETNEVIEPHDEFIFVATMNPNEVGYGGREDLDQATSSRFIPVKVPPLETSGEVQVIANETEWDENDHELNVLLDAGGGVINGLRKLHGMGKISMWPSTRDVIQIGRMAERLNDAKAATELVLLGRAGPEDEEPIKDAIQDHNW